MATIYISYKSEDQEITDSLVSLLSEKGHKIRFDKELFIGAAWRDQLLGAILDSDVVIVVWTENTYKSQFVPSEVGVVRASPQIGLLPIIVGDVPIPPFIQDLMVERISDASPQTLRKLAEKLDVSIQKHIEHRNHRKKGKPKIFISHRHKDEEVVRALVDCIRTYFIIDKEDIRCTSVRPYRLPVGENTSDRLRDEISNAEVVLGILTTDTLESSYVAFELGSAWGQRVWTCPLLACGANQSHIPDPIRDLSPLFLSNAGECFQLLNDMESFTSLKKQKELDDGELWDKIHKLVAASKTASNSIETTKTEHRFNHESETYPFMCDVISNVSPLIFSVRMSYTVREDVREVLRKRAREGDLTIYLPRMVPFAEELQRLGATIHVYADETFTPQSRFTIIRHARGDAEMFYGHDKNGQFVIRHLKASDQEPAYFLARDLIDVIKYYASRINNISHKGSTKTKRLN